MHAIVGAQIAGRREREGSAEDFIRHGEDRSEQCPSLFSQSGQITEDASQLQVPDLLQHRYGRSPVRLSAHHGFENMSAGIPIARARRRVNNDVGVDEEQLLETPFHELVEFVGGDETSAPIDYR